MIVLDTNVISEVERPKPSVHVRNWLESLVIEELWLCAPVVAELAFGARRIALRHGRTRHEDTLDHLVTGRFANRILPFDGPAALRFGALRADRQAAGRTIPFVDGMIAAICLTHGATLATRNRRDFEGFGIGMIDPFEAIG